MENIKILFRGLGFLTFIFGVFFATSAGIFFAFQLVFG
jgi:hypothetical protein